MRKGKSGKDRLKGNNGFTLLEMIAVLVIMAIIMAVALSRGIATQDAKLLVEIDTLKSHLRYAQYLAMNENETTNTSGTVKWGIQLNGTSYTLIKDISGAQTSPFNLPNESSATHNLASGITATVTGNVVLFDDWGSPGTTPSIITIGIQTITIYAETGFIP